MKSATWIKAIHWMKIVLTCKCSQLFESCNQMSEEDVLTVFGGFYKLFSFDYRYFKIQYAVLI